MPAAREPRVHLLAAELRLRTHHRLQSQQLEKLMRRMVFRFPEQGQLEVTKAQKALADAQAKLEGQRAKAEQAQRDARQMGRDSQQRGEQMQQEATQLQDQEARQGKQTQQGNQQAWMQTRNIRGAVAAVSPTFLTVRSGDQGDVRLQVNDSTAVNLDGRTASIKEILAGSDVRASYGLVDGQATAVRLDVTSSGSTTPK